MTSRIKLLLLIGIFGLACRQPGGIASPPPPQSPPPPPPPLPTAVIGGPYTSATGAVDFDGSASTDPGGLALTYSWNFGDSTKGSGARPSHTYPNDGTFTVSLVVTNSKSISSAPATTTAAVARGVLFVGAGNIATCGMTKDEATAALIDALPTAHVFTTGDNAFPNGSDAAYTNCYAPSWGRFLDRTRPVLGNHDYDTLNARGAFDYFGARLGPPGLGYYSYDLGTWHIIVLNDHGSDSLFLDPATPQGQWLTADLAAHTNLCTIAMWHVPLFNSSNVPGWTTSPQHKPIWDTLYPAGVDIVINGQQHNYERFKPMTPGGDVDTARGIREFNVGTGGSSVEDFTVSIHPNSETRAAVYGVLQLTLKATGYDWKFLPIPGSNYSDSGSGTCH